MLTIRSRGWFRWGIAFCLTVVVCNHGELWLRQRREAAHNGEMLNVNVQSEGGLFGHNSIGIDETSLSGADGERFLHFSTLGQWEFTHDSPVPCPKPIQGLSGHRASGVGFMYPLEAGDKVKTFCLLRSTQTCCYGPRPQFNQYILVETKTPVAFERLAPVLAQGVFYVDPKPDEGYIYRMEADAVRAVEEDTPEIDPVMAAKRAHLPLFDFAPLIGMAKARRESKDRETRKDSSAEKIPAALNALNGKTVTLSGYVVKRRRGNPMFLIVGKSWWDGVAQGEPPTLFNSVVVIPADGRQVPPLWKPLQTFTGTLHVNSDPAVWRHEGIVQLQKAQLGVPGVTSGRIVHTGPFVPWELEALLLGVVLLRSVGGRAKPDKHAAEDR